VDILNSATQIDPEIYPVLCTGLMDLVDDEQVLKWKNYVKNGGHLILSLRSATRNPDGHFPQIPYGDRITQLTGAVITGYDVLPAGHEGKIRLCESGEIISWKTWADQYKPDVSTRVMAEFSDQFYKGETAAFKKNMGKGSITCIGFDQAKGIEKIISQSLYEEFADLVTLPENTLFRIRGSLGIFLNYNDRDVNIPKPLYQNAKIISGSTKAAACGVSIIKYRTV
jgi:beta-galactosidase